MRVDLKKIVDQCIQCIRYDVKKEGYHPARSIDASQVWDHVEIDLIGPLPISQEGYSWIFTIVDILSGYTVLEPLRTKTMANVAKVPWKTIGNYGTMKILQSDNGAEFVNKVVEERRRCME